VLKTQKNWCEKYKKNSVKKPKKKIKLKMRKKNECLM